MEYDIVLIISFGILDVQDSVIKVSALPQQQPCLIRAYAAAVKEPEKYWECKLANQRFFPFISNGYAVAFMKKPCYFIFCKRMWDVSSFFFPWNLRRQDR